MDVEDITTPVATVISSSEEIDPFNVLMVIVLAVLVGWLAHKYAMLMQGETNA